MKKAISKTEMNLIIQRMVVEACLKKGKTMALAIEDSYNWLRDVCILNFIQSVPEIPKRQRQIELIQKGILNHETMNAQYQHLVVSVDDAVEDSWASKDFGKYTAQVGLRAESTKAADMLLWETILAKVPGLSKYITTQHLTYSYPSLSLRTRFADVPESGMPKNVYELPSKPAKTMPQEVHKHNGVLCSIHNEVTGHLKMVFDMLIEASAMREQLRQAMLCIKTPLEMERLFPEAVKHFPPTLTLPPKTKQVADPAFINQLRAKLAQGLPD